MDYRKLVEDMKNAPTENTYRQEAIEFVATLANRADRLALTSHHPAVTDYVNAWNKLSARECRYVRNLSPKYLH